MKKKIDVPNPNFISASLSVGNGLVIAGYGHKLHTHTHEYFTQVSFRYKIFSITAGCRLYFQPTPSVHVHTTHLKIHPNVKYF